MNPARVAVSWFGCMNNRSCHRARLRWHNLQKTERADTDALSFCYEIQCSASGAERRRAYRIFLPRCEYAALAEKSIFVYAFRLGARIAIDVLAADFGN